MLKRTISRLALALVLALAPSLACAAPSVVNSCFSGPGNTGTGAFTCGSGSAPANGDVIVVFGYGAGSAGPSSATDSNSVSLVQREVQTSTLAATSWLFDYTVSGSPTNTYTCNASTTNACFAFGWIEISGVKATPGTYNGAFSNSANVTVSLSNATGNIFVCAGASNGGGTITLSGVASTSTLFNNGGLAQIYGVANASSSSCVTTGTVAPAAAVAIANYAPVVVVTGCLPYPFPCVFRPG